ncbi:hypothetical protein TWF506_000438 [Arthrobotrys conoides]|uniref:Uncharacterized protein n=1 Tax=Arthrobotrys conoides TaxID=74498 RepID=A0AAN8RWY8_9PEZI
MVSVTSKSLITRSITPETTPSTINFLPLSSTTLQLTSPHHHHLASNFKPSPSSPINGSHDQFSRSFSPTLLVITLIIISASYNCDLLQLLSQTQIIGFHHNFSLSELLSSPRVLDLNIQVTISPDHRHPSTVSIRLKTTSSDYFSRLSFKNPVA